MPGKEALAEAPAGGKTRKRVVVMVDALQGAPGRLPNRTASMFAPFAERPSGVVPVNDIAIARAAVMGAPISPREIGPGSDGTPAYKHLYVAEETGEPEERFVITGTNGQRQETTGLLVAELAMPQDVVSNGTDARLTKLFGPPLSLSPYSVRHKPTSKGLAVAEVDRDRQVRVHVREGSVVADPLPLERGTILVAKQVPEEAAIAMRREKPGIIDAIRPGRHVEPNQPEVTEQRYKINKLDDLVEHADKYMRQQNTKRHVSRDYPQKPIGLEQAIRHVMERLSSPEPISDIEINRRRAADIPSNVNPVTLYRTFADQADPDIAEVLDRWVERRIVEDGADAYKIHYEGIIRIATDRWRERETMRKATRSELTPPAKQNGNPVALTRGEKNIGDGVIQNGTYMRRAPGYREHFGNSGVPVDPVDKSIPKHVAGETNFLTKTALLSTARERVAAMTPGDWVRMTGRSFRDILHPEQAFHSPTTINLDRGYRVTFVELQQMEETGRAQLARVEIEVDGHKVQGLVLPERFANYGRSIRP